MKVTASAAPSWSALRPPSSFSAHFRAASAGFSSRCVAPLSPPALACRFERVELFESRLDPGGVRYRELAAWPP